MQSFDFPQFQKRAANPVGIGRAAASKVKPALSWLWRLFKGAPAQAGRLGKAISSYREPATIIRAMRPGATLRTTGVAQPLAHYPGGGPLERLASNPVRYAASAESQAASRALGEAAAKEAPGAFKQFLRHPLTIAGTGVGGGLAATGGLAGYDIWQRAKSDRLMAAYDAIIGAKNLGEVPENLKKYLLDTAKVLNKDPNKNFLDIRSFAANAAGIGVEPGTRDFVNRIRRLRNEATPTDDTPDTDLLTKFKKRFSSFFPSAPPGGGGGDVEGIGEGELPSLGRVGPGGGSMSSPRGQPSSPPQQSGLMDYWHSLPGWGKTVGVGGGALGAGLLAHQLFGADEEEDEYGTRRRTGSNLAGPLVGLGTLGLGAGLATGWDPSKLMEGKWWTEPGKTVAASAANIPAILVPYRIKFAQPTVTTNEPPLAVPPAPVPPLPPAEQLPMPTQADFGIGNLGGITSTLTPRSPAAVPPAVPPVTSPTPKSAPWSMLSGAQRVLRADQLAGIGGMVGGAQGPAGGAGIGAGTTAGQQLAAKIMATSPEAIDPQKGFDNFAKATPGDKSSPDYWSALKQRWADMPGWQQALLSVGLTMGAIGLLGGMSGRGGWGGPLLGVGGLGLAAWMGGLFDPNSPTYIGNMFGGGRQSAAAMPGGASRAEGRSAPPAGMRVGEGRGGQPPIEPPGAYRGGVLPPGVQPGTGAPSQPPAEAPGRVAVPTAGQQAREIAEKMPGAGKYFTVAPDGKLKANDMAILSAMNRTGGPEELASVYSQFNADARHDIFEEVMKSKNMFAGPVKALIQSTEENIAKRQPPPVPPR